MGILRFKPFGKDVYIYLFNDSCIYFFNSLNIEKILISFALEIGCNSVNFQKRNFNKLNKKFLFQINKIKLFIIQKQHINKLDFLLKIYQEIHKNFNLKKFRYFEYDSFKKVVKLINYNLKLNKIGLTYVNNFGC
ncbi:hypothetical protein PMT9312_1338 [Prochlorococcus marinus str. MIT 9312]|uniref:Uncharacterized protein n=1 Tax=Prochlorococcus marinus (strain MIT 9312) TaxID=74546 RepID=Q319P7_PROM9|nr:hypothetical protein PMT9312_1338 [Prochlorococcus marinus str. MIT 9312]KGF99806.1 N-acetylneuraminate synthase [Prochlorococcus marinus str. MIT 9311]